MKKGLGRGLNSLFGDYAQYDVEEKKPEKIEEPVKNEEKVVVSKVEEPIQETKVVKNVKKQDNTPDGVCEIDISLIDRNQNQPRKNFDEKALKELAHSIKQHGIIQPLVLRKMGERYQIVAGERRFRASKMAGLKKVPAIVKEFSEREVSEIAIIENLQREDLNPIESAKAIQSLIDSYNLTQETVADRIGKSRSAVANTLRLLTLPDEIISLVEQSKLSAGHARTLLAVEDPKKQVELALFCVQKKISVRDLETMVKNLNKPAKEKQKPVQSLELKAFVEDLNKKFATKVSVIGNDKKGRIYIDYYTSADLQRIYDIMNR